MRDEFAPAPPSGKGEYKTINIKGEKHTRPDTLQISDEGILAVFEINPNGIPFSQEWLGPSTPEDLDVLRKDGVIILDLRSK